MEAAFRSEDSSLALLQTLADCCGVESLRSYETADGKAVAEESLVAILEGMGVRARTDEERRSSLESLKSRERRAVKPIMVIRHEQADKRIPLSLSRGASPGRVEWRIEEENGTRHEGKLSSADLVKMDWASGETDHYYFRLPLELASGYHSLRTRVGEEEAVSLVVVTPTECFVPEAVRHRKVWGIAAQLYSLASKRDWGIGDFTSASELMAIVADRGADVLALSPLHALPAGNPLHTSPYSPASRLALNYLYIDPEKVPDFSESEDAKRIFFSNEQALVELRRGGSIDYQRTATVKLQVLSACYDRFRAAHLARNTGRAAEFRDFCRAHGPALDEYALFEALDEVNSRRPGWGWHDWPDELSSPGTEACRAFARERHERIDFFRYLQWQASRQVEALGGEALARHMGIGLLLDLALGSDPHGAETWAGRALYASRCSVGSPPDDCNPSGQNWGFSPMIPERMREAAYQPWIRLLRSNMRYAGALRLDHVMSLWRLFWIPEGMPASAGTYVYYPADEMLGILALESHRNECMVVGEDLGVVPDEVREGMRRHKIFSYSVLMFSQNDDGTFTPPDEYEQMSIAMPNTHDLPTLEGFWEGRDLELFRQHQQYPSQEAYESAISERLNKRRMLLEALMKEGLLAGDDVPCDPQRLPFLSHDIFVGICTYLARSASRIVLVQLEDLIGQAEPINLPGVVRGFRPWSHRLTVGLHELESHERLRRMAEALQRERGRR